jgi:hypothetical protein
MEELGWAKNSEINFMMELNWFYDGALLVLPRVAGWQWLEATGPKRA